MGGSPKKDEHRPGYPYTNHAEHTGKEQTQNGAPGENQDRLYNIHLSSPGVSYHLVQSTFVPFCTLGLVSPVLACLFM
jgi:hypothetical protein